MVVTMFFGDDHVPLKPGDDHVPLMPDDDHVNLMPVDDHVHLMLILGYISGPSVRCARTYSLYCIHP